LRGDVLVAEAAGAAICEELLVGKRGGAVAWLVCWLGHR